MDEIESVADLISNVHEVCEAGSMCHLKWHR